MAFNQTQPLSRLGQPQRPEFKNTGNFGRPATRPFKPRSSFAQEVQPSYMPSDKETKLYFGSYVLSQLHKQGKKEG